MVGRRRCAAERELEAACGQALSFRRQDLRNVPTHDRQGRAVGGIIHGRLITDSMLGQLSLPGRYAAVTLEQRW